MIYDKKWMCTPNAIYYRSVNSYLTGIIQGFNILHFYFVTLAVNTPKVSHSGVSFMLYNDVHDTGL